MRATAGELRERTPHSIEKIKKIMEAGKLDPLTEEERRNWQAFNKRHYRGKPNAARVQKILEMSEAGHSIKTIYEEVRGCRGDVTEVRTRGRRQGAY